MSFKSPFGRPKTTGSAHYSMKHGTTASYTLGVAKEFFKDEVPSWMPWSEDIGWDDNTVL